MKERCLRSFTCGLAGEQKNRPGSLRSHHVRGFAQNLAVVIRDGEDEQRAFALPDQLWRGEATDQTSTLDTS